jgi:hypothetical protein
MQDPEEEDAVATVIVIQPDHSVEMFRYHSDEEFAEAWESFEILFEGP